MYDAVIIGSGPAGYECAKHIGEMGGKALVVEKNKLGGTCTNTGCMPTKSMHASASFFSELQHASKLGVSVADSSVDFSALMARKDRVVKVLSMGIKHVLTTAKAEIKTGTATIKDANTVVVDGEEISTKHIVIATGASPRKLSMAERNDKVLSSKELLELKELPSSLTIIGGGYIGCEFASIFATLGTKVTIIEAMDRIAAIEEEDISTELTRIMIRQGIEINTKATVTSISDSTVKFTHDGEEKSVTSDYVLVSIGMESNVNKEECDRLGIGYERGITINDKMQTSVPNIYAIGDVTGKIMLAHYAYAQAEVAAKNLMGSEARFDETVVPSAIFTIPEISSVGVRNSSLPSSTVKFAAIGKARAMDQPEGFVKIYHEDGYLKGFCAIGAHASDLVSEATLAIKNNLKLTDIAHTIHPHPTLSEGFSTAVELALKEN